MITYPFGFIGGSKFGTTPEAQAYLSAVLEAGGTLDWDQIDAVNDFFVSSLATGLYNTIYAMYPIIGGTAASHAINAKNPGTLPMTFTDSWTHNALGARGAGGYAEFPFSSEDIDINNNGNLAIGLYVNAQANGVDVGYDLCASDSNNAQQNFIITEFDGGNIAYVTLSGGYSNTISQGGNPIGMWYATRNSANSGTVLYRNASSTPSGTFTETYYRCETNYFLATEVVLGAPTSARNTKRYSFILFLKSSLESNQQAEITQPIIDLQTALGRA
jgi:hypothetical protein